MLADGPAADRTAATGYVRIIGPHRVAICSGASTEVVEWDDIIMARSAKNCTWVVTNRGAVRVRRPLHVVIKTLSDLGFVQIHRRAAVNDSKVRRLIRSGSRRLDILLDDELRLEVGRQFQRVFAPASERSGGIGRPKLSRVVVNANRGTEGW